MLRHNAHCTVRSTGALALSTKYESKIPPATTPTVLLVRSNQVSFGPEASIAADVEFGISLVKELPTMWQTFEPGELRVLEVCSSLKI